MNTEYTSLFISLFGVAIVSKFSYNNYNNKSKMIASIVYYVNGIVKGGTKAHWCPINEEPLVDIIVMLNAPSLFIFVYVVVNASIVNENSRFLALFLLSCMDCKQSH